MTSTSTTGQRLSKQAILDEIRSKKTNVAKFTGALPFSAQQARSEKDGPARGPTHVVRSTLSADAVNAAQLQSIVANATADLAQGHAVKYDMSTVADVQCEWIGYRKNGSSAHPGNRDSLAEQYETMVKDATSGLVILFTAGGASVSNSPLLYRPFLTNLARTTGGRVINVKKRLAPQHPYPAGLVDFLLAYLYLLYPPPGSLHKPIPASNIVLAGNSHGASVALATVLTILHFSGSSTNPDGSSSNPFSHSPRPTLDFSGYERQLPLPAGVLVLSPAPEIHPALLSFFQNQDKDMFSAEHHPALYDSFPPDDIWPSKPPREHPYCYKEMLAHPMVSPNMAAARFWEACPPIYVDIGTDECYRDGTLVLVDALRSVGVKVTLDEYEAMPHDFFMFFPKWWQANKLIESVTQITEGMIASRSQSTWGVWNVDGSYMKKDWQHFEALDWRETTDIIRAKALERKPLTGTKSAKSKI
ncbi:Hypothetical protein D9617_1g084350 [Elsinoe fawcettii]|nr:Hypothetical protein D9617_1g084350 [Elsinoe fawcettii]